MPDPVHGDQTATDSAETLLKTLGDRLLDGRNVAPWLWAVTMAAVIGDLVTTLYGLSVGLSEQNPVVAAMIGEFGVLGMLGLKAFAIAWVVAVWWRFDRKYGLAALVGLFLPQALAVVVNVVTILQA